MQWGDSFEPFKQSFFLPTCLLTEVPHKAAKSSSKSPTTSSVFPSTVARHQICDSWSWYDDCSSSDCPKSHIRVVCKRPGHQELSCPKRKFPVPPRRSDTASKDWLDDRQADFSSSTSQTFDQPPDPPASDMTGYRPSSPAPRFPLNSSLTSQLITLHAQLRQAPGPNAFTFRLPVPSQLNIPVWRIASYPDTPLCDFLEFGWPVGYSNDATPISSTRNHGSALSHPEVIDAYLARECELGATCGPISSNPLSHALTTSPLQIAYSRTGKPRVVVDLSFPHGYSVNAGIPSDTYLGEEFKLRLPGVDALLDIIRLKGRHCHLFKLDLSRAYRQLRIDQRDYHLLGFCHRGSFYFDIAPPFGLLPWCANALPTPSPSCFRN